MNAKRGGHECQGTHIQDGTNAVKSLILNHELMMANQSEKQVFDSWMTYQGSLTNKLKEIAGDARIELLGQGLELSNDWEKERLGITDSQVFRREIVMWAFDEPCWYARTIIPNKTYQADLSFFGRLRQESMGDLIFNGPTLKREDFKNYSIDVHSTEYEWARFLLKDTKTLLWIRLSTFTLRDDSPFFLIEILLPGLRRYNV